MIPAIKQKNKWKTLLYFWVLILLTGWLPVFIPPPYSGQVLLGIIIYGLWVTFLIIFLWEQKILLILRFIQQIVPLLLLIMSIRSVLLMSSNVKYALIALLITSYLLVLVPPDLSYPKVRKAVNKWTNKYANKILMVISIFGIAGASIGIFGGRIYGWKVLIIPGIVLGVLSIAIARYMQNQELH